MAKQIITVSVKARQADATRVEVDLLAIGMLSDGARQAQLWRRVDKKLGGTIAKLRRFGDFTGKVNTTALLYGDGKVGAKRILLVGLGSGKKTTIDTVRKAGALAANKAIELKAGNDEVTAMLLRAALADIGNIEAEHVDEKILENIFKNFCIGK